jgi:hypothetical protein
MVRMTGWRARRMSFTGALSLAGALTTVVD